MLTRILKADAKREWRIHALDHQREPERDDWTTWLILGGRGAVTADAGVPLAVNIHLPGVQDAESFRRSETQIAAALARAVGRGQRNL